MEPQRLDQAATIIDGSVSPQHYYEAVTPHSGIHPGTIPLVLLSVLVAILVIVGAIFDLPLVKSGGVALFQVALILAFIMLVVVLPGTIGYHLWHKHKLAKEQLTHARLDREAKQQQIDQEEADRRLARDLRERQVFMQEKALSVQLYLDQTRLHADQNGNRPFIFEPTHQAVIEIASGNFPQPVPNRLHLEHNDTSTRNGQDNAIADTHHLHIPTFAESLAAGDIGPNQRDMLFCYELLQDEMSKKFTGISPIRGEIQQQHTQLVVAGSTSGKSTYMASNMAQATVLGTLFLMIDPHLNHPERSLAMKMKAYAPWFILPPARTHEEIRKVVNMAIKIRDDRMDGKRNQYDGYHIMVVIDEVPSLMAFQKSSDKQIKQLYIDLALLMQSLGVATAKFGITGLYGTQFATKDELGEIDFRDACMSTLVMKIHPVQAQAMRVLGKDAVATISKLEKGHGYLLLADGTETRRVASGNATENDLAQLAAMLPSSPFPAVWKPVPKPVENQFQRRSNLPLSDTVESSSNVVQSSSIPVVNQFTNQFPAALQAQLDEMGISEAYINLKADRVTEMLGEKKADIVLAVWGKYPSRGEAYETVEKEYQLVMEVIRYRASNNSMKKIESNP